jgi:hypothetical protein
LVSPDLKNERLRALMLVVLVGTTISILFHYLGTQVWSWSHVRSTFLFWPPDLFGDTINPVSTVRASWHSSSGALVLFYTPFYHVVYLLLSTMRWWAALLVQLAVFLTALVLVVWRFLVDRLPSLAERLVAVVILVAFSYPVLFVAERGNLEMVVFAVLAGFLYAYYAKHSVWCVALLAVAISLKLFPAVFLVLLLADRRYRWAGLALVGSIALTLSSAVAVALSMGRSLTSVFAESLSAQSTYNAIMVRHYQGVPYGNSLWGALVTIMERPYAASFVGIFSTSYLVVAVLVFALVSLLVIKIVKRPWQRVALLTLSALLLPNVSGDYRLLYVYLPLALLINAPERSSIDLACLVLFGCLLVPMDYRYGVAFFDWGWAASATSSSVVVYPVVMVAIMALVARDAWRTAQVRPSSREA